MKYNLFLFILVYTVLTAIGLTNVLDIIINSYEVLIIIF